MKETTIDDLCARAKAMEKERKLLRDHLDETTAELAELHAKVEGLSQLRWAEFPTKVKPPALTPVEELAERIFERSVHGPRVPNLSTLSHFENTARGSLDAASAFFTVLEAMRGGQS